MTLALEEAMESGGGVLWLMANLQLRNGCNICIQYIHSGSNGHWVSALMASGFDPLILTRIVREGRAAYITTLDGHRRVHKTNDATTKHIGSYRIADGRTYCGSRQAG
jgi:hypothetical protein